jgi:hypothetical protein
MIEFVLATVCWLTCLPQRADTLAAMSLRQAPMLDGRVTDREYGTPALHFETGAGEVRVWLARHGGFLYLAATIPDSTYYWGDDLVISLAPRGRGARTLAVGDRQWYLRRTLDSSLVSVVTSASSGRWSPPGQAQPTLGATRHAPDWDVASMSTATGWAVELRVRERVVRPTAAAPRLALRTFNDRPQGWWSWPKAPPEMPAQRVERTPSLWIPIEFH